MEKLASSAPVGQQEARVVALEHEIEKLRREVRTLRIANGELERIVGRDTLTPVHNRRYFINALNQRIMRLERYGTRAAIVFVDVDGLKCLNDTHGHGAGDFALVHVAQLLAANIRNTDVVARIGGDEFALILEEMGEEEAQAKIAQLAGVLAQSRCDYCDVPLRVGASFGLAILRGGDRDEDVMARADAAMYATKRRGRD